MKNYLKIMKFIKMYVNSQTEGSGDFDENGGEQ